MNDDFLNLNKKITNCNKCSRLVKFRNEISLKKRKQNLSCTKKNGTKKTNKDFRPNKEHTRRCIGKQVRSRRRQTPASDGNVV